MKKSTLFFFLVIIALISLNVYISANRKLVDSSQNLSCKQLLDHASRLAAKKVYGPSAKYFTKYIDSCNLETKDAAITYLRVADLHYDAQDYGKALSAYYLAETLDKELKKFTSQKIVNTLEKLDLSKEAQFEMDKRVAVDEESSADKTKAVARIGKKYIYGDILEEQFSELPEETRKLLDNPQLKASLLREYVKQEALYMKAQRMGLEEEKLIQNILEQTKKQLLIKSLLEREMSEQLKVSDEELLGIYEQQKAQLSQEASLGLRFIALTKGIKIEAAKKKLAKKQDQAIWIDASFTYIPELGSAEEVVAKLFKLDAGDYSKKETIDGTDYLFYIVEKKTADVVPFADIKEQLKTQYLQQKEKVLTQEIINKIIQEEDVEIFPVPTVQQEQKDIKDDLRVEKK